MENCPECKIELNDENKCSCGYCAEHCKCGVAETPKEEGAELSDLGETEAGAE